MEGTDGTGEFGNTRDSNSPDSALTRDRNNTQNSKMKEKRQGTAKNYTVTIFKFPEDWKRWIGTMVPAFQHNYIFGYEICPKTKKEHLQGFVSFPKRLRAFSIIKEQYGDSVHIEVMKPGSSVSKNVMYCSKDNDYISTFPIEKKSWNVFEDYISDFRNVITLVEAREKMGYLMYKEQSYKIIFDSKKRKDICDAIWRFNKQIVTLPEDDEALLARQEMERLSHKKAKKEVVKGKGLYDIDWTKIDLFNT